MIDHKYFNGKSNTKNREDFIFIGHNAGKYDMVLMLPYVLAFFPVTYIGTPTFIKQVSFANIRFNDSCLTLKGSLRSLAKAFKVEGSKGDLDFNSINRGNMYDKREEVEKYCM